VGEVMGGDDFQAVFFLGGGLIVLFALWAAVETKYPRDTDDRRSRKRR
jgi:hypothetical protein